MFCTTSAAAVDTRTTDDAICATRSGNCCAHDMIVIPPTCCARRERPYVPVAPLWESTASRSCPRMSTDSFARTEFTAAVPTLVVGHHGAIAGTAGEQVVQLRIPVLGGARPSVHEHDHVPIGLLPRTAHR